MSRIIFETALEYKKFVISSFKSQCFDVAKPSSAEDVPEITGVMSRCL